MRISSTEALPVRLAVAGADAPSLRRWIESVVGWQAVDAETAALVPPRIAIADVRGAATAPAELPLLLLVGTEDDPVAAASAGRDAAAVIAWPAQRDAIVEVVGRLMVAPDHRPRGVVRVGGASGGVGTTTVALALGGLAAWRGTPTLVVSRGQLPFDGVTVVDGEGIDGWAAGMVPPGCERLRVLSATADADIHGGHAGMVIEDVGVDADVDVVVVRRDRAGVDGLRRTIAAVGVVVDSGPADGRVLRAAAGGRRLVTVAWSHRVALAGLRGRVPAGLPGAWLRGLAAALPSA